MRTSSTTRTSPTTGCWPAPAWRRARARRSRSTTRSRCPPPDAIARADGGFVLGVEHDEFIAGLPDDAYDVVVLGASVFVRIEAAHAETQQLIAALRDAVSAFGAAARRRLRRRPALHGLRRRARAGALSASSTRSSSIRASACSPTPTISPRCAARAACCATPARAAAIRSSRSTCSTASTSATSTASSTAASATAAGRTPSASAAARARSSPAWAARTAASSAPAIRAGGHTGRKLYQPIPLTRLKHWAYLLRTAFGARKLIVLDEMVNVRPDFEAMLRAFNELDLTYDFPNGMRADHLSREAIELMQGRVSMLSISAESADARRSRRPDRQGPEARRHPSRRRLVPGARRAADDPLHHRLSLGDAGAHHRDPGDGVGPVRSLRRLAVDAVRHADPRHRSCTSSAWRSASSRPTASISRTARCSSTGRRYDPPNCPPGYVAKARAAFDMKMAARAARAS